MAGGPADKGGSGSADEWASMLSAQAGVDDPTSEAALRWAETMRDDERIGSGAAAERPGPRRDELDELLGVSSVELRREKSGIVSLVHAKDVTYERLPMLEVVFDRLERMLTTSMRNFTSENVDINLESITAQRFGDYLNAVPLPAMIAVFKAVEWDNFGLVTVDSPMIYSMVDVLLGGRRGSVPMRIEGRPYTTIEVALVERLVKLVLDDLGAAFAPIAPIHFRFERMETNPRFAAIARPGNACILFKMRVDLEERGGCIEFLIPYATLEPARDLLLQMFMGEKFGRDSIWETHLAREIWHTDVELEAVLEEQSVSLDQVLRLKVGSVLNLGVRPDSTIMLRCGGIPMLKGRVGRAADRMVVQIEERLDTHREVQDG
ncbi:MAG: flagellar motor switch protein FliM [Geminicoccaceae bacterium]